MSDCVHFVALSEDGPYCAVGHVHSCFGCEDYSPWCEKGGSMDMFDDPGDLGFFDEKEEVSPADVELDNEFYEPIPGEKIKKPGVKDNEDGTASFTGTLIGFGF